jgi:hypothetical protein
LRKSLFYELTTSACNSPLAFAIVRRSAWSIPMYLTHSRTFALFTTNNNTVDMGHASFLSSSRIQASACLTKCSGEGILSVFKQALA